MTPKGGGGGGVGICVFVEKQILVSTVMSKGQSDISKAHVVTPGSELY